MQWLDDGYLKPADPVLNPDDELVRGLAVAMPCHERAGTTARDLSGNANDGTSQGGAGWTVGLLGPAITSNGSSTYWDFGTTSNARNNFNGNLRVALWMRLRTATFGYIWSDFDAAGNNSQGSIYQLNNKLGWFQSGGAVNQTSTATYAAGDLVHVVFERDHTAKTVKCWINGVADFSVSYSGSITAQASCGNRTLGRAGSYVGSGSYTQADYHDLRVWRDQVPLTDGQARRLYAEDRWRLYLDPHGWGPSVVAQLYTVTLTATVTAAATVWRDAGRLLTAAASAGAGAQKAVSRTYSATATGAAVLVRQAGRIFTAAATGAATLVRSPGRILSATQSAAAVLVRLVGRTLATSATPAANVRRDVGKLLTTTQTSESVVVRSVGRLLAAAATGTAALRRDVAKRLLAGLTADAQLSRAAFLTLQAAESALATLNAGLLFVLTLAAGAAPEASLTRMVGKLAAAGQTTAVSVRRGVILTVATGATAAGVVIRLVGRTLAATTTGGATLAVVFRAATTLLRTLRRSRVDLFSRRSGGDTARRHGRNDDGGRRGGVG